MGISFSSANSLCLRLLRPSMFVKGPKKLRRATRRDPAKIAIGEASLRSSERRNIVTFLINEARACSVASFVVFNVRVIVASLSSRAVDGVKHYIIQDVNVPLFP